MIKRYTVKRINDDMYETQEHELSINRRGVAYWESISSFTYFDPQRDDYPPQALKNHPWRTIRKIGGYYMFYACVYYFPDPRLAGKFGDYNTALGWDER